MSYVIAFAEIFSVVEMPFNKQINIPCDVSFFPFELKNDLLLRVTGKS
jgi:hypothetical protein